MRIQHNIMAMNAYRNYNNNNKALSGNLEKLSSGYKINRAGDDAAGLAISEKMRAQITGLSAAQKNVKDGISLVKTAEGAMQEIQDMLNRMDYLATQSANGTYQDKVDREALQQEVDALREEINRIADSANFNGIKLLDGSLDASIEATDAVTETVTVDPSKSEALTFASGKLAEVGQVLGTNTVLHNEANGTNGTSFSVDFHNFTFNAAKGNSMTIKMGDSEIKLTAKEDLGKKSGADLVGAFLGAGGYKIEVDGKEVDTLDGMKINGQTMKVDKATDPELAYRLTFTQEKAPASEAEEINGAMEVNISGQVEAKKAEFTFSTSDLTGGPTVGGVVTINGQSYTIKNTAAEGATPQAQTWAQVFKDMEKEGILDEYKVKEDNGTVTLTAKETGEKTTPTISYKATEQKQKTNGDQTSIAAAAKADKFTSGGLTVGTVTATDKIIMTVSYKDANGTAKTKDFTHTVAAGNDDAAVATALKNAIAADTELSGLFNITGDATGLIFEAKTAGANKGSVTGLAVAVTDANDVAGDATTTATLAAKPTDEGKQVAGADAVLDTWEYDVTGWNDSNLGKVVIADGNDGIELDYDKLSAAGERGIKVGEYVATLDGSTLTLTAQTAGVPTNQATANFEYNTYAAPVKLTAAQIDVVEQGAEGGEMQGITEGAHGDFNVSTTNIKNITSGGAERLASTFFDLTEDMVKDGASIKIGEDEFIFTTDEKKVGTSVSASVKYVDARGDLVSTAKNLTEAARNNAVWTVGHDGSRITLTETVAHGGLDDHADLKAYREDSDTIFDLSTKEGIEQSLSFVGTGSYTKENVVSEATEGGKALNLQIGDTSDSWNQMKVSIGDMHVSAMKYTDEDGNETSIGEISVGTSEDAQKAVDVIKNAINYVSSVRGQLGAYQNRLDHTANNLSVMAENIQDAESTIRDTDVAEEMMSYVKNNILVQSAQAMLAQANQLPQGVLQLLG